MNALFTFQQGNADSKYGANSYLVGSDGNVELPLIGPIPVVNRTTDEVADTLRVLLTKYMESPSVNVRLMNFTITVLGEVNKPGVYEVAGAQANVLEALGLAGDLTIYGKRENVLLIRESDSKREYHRLDLTKSDFLTSNWYNLKNKDVIYVEPSKGRTSSDDNLYRVLPVVLSTLTFLTVIITNLSN